MGEIVLKEGTQTPKKKKGMPGFFKFLIIFICVIVGLAVLLVAVAFICFYDNSHKEVPVKADYETSEVFNEVMVDSLDRTKADKEINFKLVEGQLNQIIYNAFKDKPEVTEYIKNFYVEANDGTFNFNIEASALNFVKSKLVLTTTLEVTEDVMTFKVTNIKLGKINGLQGMVGLITQYVPISDINNSLASAGIHMEINLGNLTITYALNDFYNDILHLMGDGSDSSFMSIFKEIIGHDELRTIDATGDNIFALHVDLAKLAVSETTVGIADYHTPNGYFDELAPQIITDVKTLLNHGVISESNATAVANYFLGGDVLLSTSEQTAIQPYKSNAEFNSYAYGRYDYTVDPSEGLKANVKSQIISQMPTNSINIEVETSDLDNMFKTSTALGKLTLFLRDKNKGVSDTKDYKINFVNIDRISTVFDESRKNMELILSINFNGQVGNITLKCTKQSTDAGFGVLKLDISDIYLGDIAVSAETKASFVSLISDAMGTGSFDSLITIDTDNVMTINLKSTLDENGVLEALGYQTSFAFSANTATEAGGLIIHADK